MNKVVAINLNGAAYQVDEDGYGALRAYLDRARSQLGGNPDIDEIMADLEQAIADRCDHIPGSRNGMVSASDIERILEAIGPVDWDTSGADFKPSEGARRESSNSQARNPRRLYKIKNGKILDGVCNGLAAYFGMDVTIVRLICVAIAFGTSGIAVVGYLILMLVIPEASTPEEEAAAHGTPVTAQEFMDRTRSWFHEVLDRTKSWFHEVLDRTKSWFHEFKSGKKSKS